MRKLFIFLSLLSCRQPKQCTPTPPHYQAQEYVFSHKVDIDFWIGASATDRDSTYLLGFTRQKADSALFDLMYINLGIQASAKKEKVAAITLYYVTTLPQAKVDSLKFGSLMGWEVWYEEQDQMWCTLFQSAPDSTKIMIFGKPLSENHRWNYNHYKAVSRVKGCRYCLPAVSAIVLNNPDQDEAKIKKLQQQSGTDYTDSLSYYFGHL